MRIGNKSADLPSKHGAGAPAPEAGGTTPLSSEKRQSSYFSLTRIVLALLVLFIGYFFHTEMSKIYNGFTAIGQE